MPVYLSISLHQDLTYVCRPTVGIPVYLFQYTFLPLPFKAFGDHHCQDPPRFHALATNESYSLDKCVFTKIEKKTSMLCHCDVNSTSQAFMRTAFSLYTSR
ncbi:hypothetical protein ElyMa_000852500 [Elysia marginata]|uniref:Uncharacterized protein n=1 Tax=Elysia marginata TaxID=1093978 RepID=A0AAV4H432_9GAST|nr:hypothetical protein ElyMa_000852500 [Elysia marginata]